MAINVNNLRVYNMIVGAGSSGGGGGGGSLYSSNVLFHYDIGDTNSYPGTGTTISDLSGNGYDLTMTHTGNYTSSGTSSYLDSFRIYETGLYPNMYGENGSPVSFTMSGWLKTGSSTSYGYEFAGYLNSPFQVNLTEPGAGTPRLTTNLKFKQSGGSSTMTAQYYLSNPYNVITHNDWFNFTLVADATAGVSYYINGQVQTINQGSRSGTAVTLPTFIDTSGFGNSSGNGGITFDHRTTQAALAHLIFYNETLTASQISTNFDALKSRYGY